MKRSGRTERRWRITWGVAIALSVSTVGALVAGYLTVQLLFLPETLAQAQLDRVPELTGQEVEEALEEGAGEGYAVLVQGREHDDEVEAGRVVYQIPPPGTYLPRGDTLRLLVSLGPSSVTMPDVAGLEPELAGRVLARLGLRTAGTRQEASDRHPQGTVMETVPPAGAPVEEGTPITLVVSRGGSFLDMPDVRGLELAAARETIEGHGLVVGDVAGVERTAGGEMRVVVTGQDPSPGRRVRAGTAVRLLLGEVRRPAETGSAP